MGFVLKPRKFRANILEALRDLDPGLRSQIESIVVKDLPEEEMERRIINILGEERGRRLIRKMKGEE
nr:hypothetical protein [Candidatus Bathyarchaeota archaeon]